MKKLQITTEKTYKLKTYKPHQSISRRCFSWGMDISTKNGKLKNVCRKKVYIPQTISLMEKAAGMLLKICSKDMFNVPQHKLTYFYHQQFKLCTLKAFSYYKSTTVQQYKTTQELQELKLINKHKNYKNLSWQAHFPWFSPCLPQISLDSLCAWHKIFALVFRLLLSTFSRQKFSVKSFPCCRRKFI